MDSARCMLEDKKLGNSFWGLAVLTAAHVHNRLPSQSHADIFPLQHWTGKVPSIGHLHVIGSTAWVHIPKEKRQKLDSKSVRCVFVGYEEDAGSKVYKLYNTSSKRVILSRDVIIDESQEVVIAEPQLPTLGWEPELESLPHTIREDSSDGFLYLDPITPQADQRSFSSATDNIHDSIIVRLWVAQPWPAGTGTGAGAGAGVGAGTGTGTGPPAVVQTDNGRRDKLGVQRSGRNKEREELFHSGANFALVATGEDAEPQTLTDALNSLEKAQWKQA